MPPASPALRRSSYSPGSACALASCRASAHERARSGPKTSSGPLGRESALIVWAVTSSSLVSLRGHQRSSEVIRGHQRLRPRVLSPCETIACNHAQSSAIRRNHGVLSPCETIACGRAPSGAIGASHAQSSAIRRNHAQSSAIRRNHAQSSAIWRNHAQSSAIRPRVPNIHVLLAPRQPVRSHAISSLLPIVRVPTLDDAA